MITLENVTFGYTPRRTIIENLSLTAAPGQPVCLWGPSGCGKTTVLRLVMGLEKPRSGKIIRPEGLRISAVFQEDRLIRTKTALENVALFCPEEEAEEMLRRLGLGDGRNQRPAALSGGMRRRVALARALAHPFDLLVLDEALTGLDDDTKAICLDAIREAAAGKYLLLATHDRAEAEALGAEIAVL